MPDLTSGMQTALGADAPLVFCAFKLVMPSFTLRLLDGAGTLTVNGETYSGLDSTYGTLGDIANLVDGIDQQAPHLRISVLPPTNVAAAALANAAAQGSSAYLYIGAVTRSTGVVVSDPDPRFTGQLDVATLKVGRGRREVEFDIASYLERFFDVDEGFGLNSAFHKSIWPLELGFDFVTDVTRQLPWGSDAPRPGVIHDYRGGGIIGLILRSGAGDNRNMAV